MPHDPLSTLRELTEGAQDLAVPWEHFMTHCAESPAFLMRCTTVEGPEPVRLAVQALGQEVFGRPLDPARIFYLKLQGEPFFHGIAMATTGMLTWYYFTDLDVGVAVKVAPGSPQITLARLRSIPAPKGAVFVTPPTGAVEL